MTYRILINQPPEIIHKIPWHITFGELEERFKEEMTLLLSPLSGGSVTFESTFPIVSLVNFVPISLCANYWPNGVVPYIIMDNNEEDISEIQHLKELINQAAVLIHREFPNIRFRNVRSTDTKCVLFRYPTIYGDYHPDTHPFPFGCPISSDTLTVYVPKVLNYTSIMECLNSYFTTSSLIHIIIDYYKVVDDVPVNSKLSSSSNTTIAPSEMDIITPAPKWVITSGFQINLSYMVGQLLEILGINLNSQMNDEYFTSPDQKTGRLHQVHSQQINTVEEYKNIIDEHDAIRFSVLKYGC